MPGCIAALFICDVNKYWYRWLSVNHHGHCASSEAPAALLLCSGLLPLPAEYVLWCQLRHGGQVRPVQQEARRLQVLAHMEGFRKLRAGAEGGQSPRHGQVSLRKRTHCRAAANTQWQDGYLQLEQVSTEELNSAWIQARFDIKLRKNFLFPSWMLDILPKNYSACRLRKSLNYMFTNFIISINNKH